MFRLHCRKQHVAEGCIECQCRELLRRPAREAPSEVVRKDKAKKDRSDIALADSVQLAGSIGDRGMTRGMRLDAVPWGIHVLLSAAFWSCKRVGCFRTSLGQRKCSQHCCLLQFATVARWRAGKITEAGCNHRSSVTSATEDREKACGGRRKSSPEHIALSLGMDGWIP